MKAEDTSPPVLECAVIDKPIIMAAAASLAWGDRWRISLTAAKVTRLEGPAGGWGRSFYRRLDL